VFLTDLADSDLIYTETLMQRGKENFEGKEVLILGGGDGALLYELLKEKPKFVTMLEIDDVVMNACKKYLRKCCGTCLDDYNTDNYKVGYCYYTIFYEATCNLIQKAESKMFNWCH
jgi:spermine synthase